MPEQQQPTERRIKVGKFMEMTPEETEKLEAQYYAASEIVTTGFNYIGLMRIVSGYIDVPLNYMEMLHMHGLYNQVKHGPCTKAEPYKWNIVEWFKWECWQQLGQMPKHEAMAKYVGIFLDRMDYAAKMFNWDKMLKTWKKEFNKFDKQLRPKFRMLQRELIKPDGTKQLVSPPPSVRYITGSLCFHPDAVDLHVNDGK
ncbi:hypothetical protein PMAYCL1PPCAC_05724 [Pristionchus mayeri]|uniref:ACB domain-containing protein n=1 Tax=Pristionchus mayeri TaxID=1317129 RepID=A0AAN4Z8X2_9BILA|nr:hypothetical protein PMAYCL1PPCAC_05724 [Pristionchus mayeri]